MTSFTLDDNDNTKSIAQDVAENENKVYLFDDEYDTTTDIDNETEKPLLSSSRLKYRAWALSVQWNKTKLHKNF